MWLVISFIIIDGNYVGAMFKGMKSEHYFSMHK